MKKMLKSILGVLFLGAALMACKKDENKVTFDGNGSAITFASSASGSFVFTRVTSGDVFSTMSWNNPDFKFNTGISSQDVTYTLEVKQATQANFIGGATIAKDLSKVFTKKEINDILTLPAPGGLDLDPLVPQDIQMRIRASVAGAPQSYVYSNVLSFVITPYSNDPDLWITGNGTPSNWTNSPPAAQKFAYSRATKKHTITMAFTPGNQYKFLTVSGQWQPQWGGCSPTGGSISENPGGGSDPAAIDTPPVAGNYLITVDLVAKTCTVVKL
ncbi:MAG: SusE domain-containing protein [Ferruginibacter sp.]